MNIFVASTDIPIALLVSSSMYGIAIHIAQNRQHKSHIIHLFETWFIILLLCNYPRFSTRRPLRYL